MEQIQPSPVVTLNRAVAISKARGAEEALALIEPLSDVLAGYFHFHGVRGADLGEDAQAIVAFQQALELARTPAEAAHLRGRLAMIRSPA